MRFDRPLDGIFRGRGSVRVLRALTELPSGHPVSAREIGRRAGVSHPTASAVLDVLADEGIVMVRRAPRGDAYELNLDHQLVSPIAATFASEKAALNELVSFLRAAFAELPLRAAYLFGSVVRGEAEPSSDIDVAVVHERTGADEILQAVDRIADDVSRRFGNRLSVITTSIDPSKLKGGSARLWKRVVDEGIQIA